MRRALLAIAACCLLVVLLLGLDDAADVGTSAPVRDDEGGGSAVPLLRGNAPTDDERLEARGGDAVVPAGVGRGIEPTGADLVGRVVGPDGTSLRYAVVRAFVVGPGGEPEWLGSVGTAAQGRLWLRLVRPEERVHLQVLPPPGAEEPLAPTVVWDVPTRDVAQEIEVDPGVWLEGDVVDATGRPVERARLVLRAEAEGEAWLRRENVVAGHFRIAVAPGRHRLTARPYGGRLAVSPAQVVRAPAEGVRLVCPARRPVGGALDAPR